MSMRREIRFSCIAAIDPILRHTDPGCAPSRLAVINADAKKPRPTGPGFGRCAGD
jgi:hypothetical protein